MITSNSIQNPNFSQAFSEKNPRKSFKVSENVLNELTSHNLASLVKHFRKPEDYFDLVPKRAIKVLLHHVNKRGGVDRDILNQNTRAYMGGVFLALGLATAKDIRYEAATDDDRAVGYFYIDCYHRFRVSELYKEAGISKDKIWIAMRWLRDRGDIVYNKDGHYNELTSVRLTVWKGRDDETRAKKPTRYLKRKLVSKGIAEYREKKKQKLLSDLRNGIDTSKKKRLSVSHKKTHRVSRKILVNKSMSMKYGVVSDLQRNFRKTVGFRSFIFENPPSKNFIQQDLSFEQCRRYLTADEQEIISGKTLTKLVQDVEKEVNLRDNTDRKITYVNCYFVKAARQKAANIRRFSKGGRRRQVQPVQQVTRPAIHHAIHPDGRPVLTRDSEYWRLDRQASEAKRIGDLLTFKECLDKMKQLQSREQPRIANYYVPPREALTEESRKKGISYLEEMKRKLRGSECG